MTTDDHQRFAYKFGERTVALRPETVARLDRRRDRGQTYDELINELLDRDRRLGPTTKIGRTEG